MKMSEFKLLTYDILVKMMKLNCYLIFMPKESFRLSNWKTKGEFHMIKHCQNDMVYYHKKGGDCEEDFLLRLYWVLMITNSHHKRIKIMETQDEDERLVDYKVWILVSMIFIFDLLLSTSI